jgi:hypothetical protein
VHMYGLLVPILPPPMGQVVIGSTLQGGEGDQ